MNRYDGRRGIVGVVTALSTRATNEQEAAIGSFLFFAADARFLRSAMSRAARAMRATDPTLNLAKH